jgi:hypothetical protein
MTGLFLKTIHEIKPGIRFSHYHQNFTLKKIEGLMQISWFQRKF